MSLLQRTSFRALCNLPRNNSLYNIKRTIMSENQKKLHRYMVWAPDCTDPEAIERRFKVRDQHLSDIGPLLNKSVKVGGMLVAPGTENDEGRKQAVGSILIVEAESIEEVEKLVKSDIYFTSRTWDPEKLQILPFFPATAFP